VLGVSDYNNKASIQTERKRKERNWQEDGTTDVEKIKS
jgi:hypothetical protein